MSTKLIGYILVVVLSFLLMRCAQAPKTTREVAQVAGQLPDHEKWAAMEKFATDLDLSHPGYELSVSKGGTSVYVIVQKDKKPLGAVLPENSATVLSGEVLSFHLARVFGVSEIYQPGFYKFLSGANLKAFADMIPKEPYQEAKFANKEMNRKAVLERIQRNPNGIDAIYKDWAIKPSDYEGLEDWRANTLSKTHIIAGSKTPFANFLKCEGPQPSRNVEITMNGAKTTEYEAAKELAAIMVIDALTQQWDRFSMGNLQTIKLNGKVHIAAFDNGGTWGGIKWTNKYVDIVSRFDRDIAQKVLDLNAFLNEGRGTFMGLRSETELMQALGVAKLPGSFKKFKESLKILAVHVANKQGCYFE